MPKLGEQPKNREIFDKNEENIESIKKQISEATASGDMDKVAELASKGKEFNNQKKELKKSNENEAYEDAKIEDQKEAIEMNKQFDETKPAEEVAKEKARIAEQDRITAEKEATKLAEIRAKIQGGDTENSPTKTSTAEKTKIDTATPEQCLAHAKEVESKGFFASAAESYQKGGDEEKAKENWEKNGKELEEMGDSFNAAESYEKAGNTDSANKMFEETAKRFEERGWNSQVGEVRARIKKAESKTAEKGAGSQNETEKNAEKTQEIKASLMSLFNSAGYRSWEEKSKGIGSIEEAIDKLDQKSQEKLGEEFFNETIGQNIMNNKGAYEVYRSFKKSGFTDKFHQLEDSRLKEWRPDGSGFIL